MIKRYFRIERKKISFLKFILEAYDGLAVLSTIDPHKGLIMLRIAPGCETYVNYLLNDLSQLMIIQEQQHLENQQ